MRIGNSRGVRIPKPLIEQAGLGDEVDLHVQNGSVVVRSARRSREGWDDAFAAMARRGDDRLIDFNATPATRFDASEWQWR